MLNPTDRDISFPRTSGNSLSTYRSPHHRGPICLKTVLLPTAVETSNLTSGSSAMKGSDRMERYCEIRGSQSGAAEDWRLLSSYATPLDKEFPTFRKVVESSISAVKQNDALYFATSAANRPALQCCIIHKWKHPTFLRFALKRSVSLSSELYLASLVQRHAPKTLKT